MKQYLMLTNEELKRSWKMIVSVVLAMASIEILIIVGRVIYHERQVKEYMSYAKLSESDAIETIGKLSFEQASSYFSYIILFGVALVLLYAVQIWYRDWLGESKYIYRLLLLPGSRAKIFFAKWTSLALVIISFIGLQWAVIQFSYVVFNWLIKDDYRTASLGLSSDIKTVVYDEFSGSARFHYVSPVYRQFFVYARTAGAVVSENKRTVVYRP